MKKYLLLLLLACGISKAQVFTENFNGGALPLGWTVNNPDTIYNWEVGNQSGFAIFPTGAAFFDDDAAGLSSINSNARLISPIINLSAVSNPKLSFKYANRIFSYDSSINVEVFNGSSWVQVFSSVGTSGTWDFDTEELIAYETATNIDLSPYANANFQLRFIYNDAGDYSYGAAIDDVIITSAVLSTSETSLLKGLEVYPNPVKDNFHIKSVDLKSDSKITVVDMSGKLIKIFIGNSDRYNISDIPKGPYMILINNGKKTITKKIFKE